MTTGGSSKPPKAPPRPASVPPSIQPSNPPEDLRSNTDLNDGLKPNVTGQLREPESEKNPMQRLVGGPVVVSAGGIEYEGTLVGASEYALHIKTLTGPKEIPLDRVTKVCRPGERPHLDADSPLTREFFEDPGDVAPGVSGDETGKSKK